MKKIVFVTGTRADYGKLKSLMRRVHQHADFELHIFVTGMHLLSKYGATYKEVENDGFVNIYKFVNQKLNQPMDITLSNTILGFSNYVSEISPDLIVVHGDRIEALAGAIVGAINNIQVAHIEGGEVSGTIDESIRHAITKFAHIHLVANEEAKQRVIQLGEKEELIYVIGSPDIDIMNSAYLPSIYDAKNRYEIFFEDYAILMYHPVTTEVTLLGDKISEVVEAVLASEKNYVVIYPNNDEGSHLIINAYARLEGNSNFRIFPSIRFEYFLTLLSHADFIIGNSSAGIREAEVYGVPVIDLGNRQYGRYNPEIAQNIVNVGERKEQILQAINQISGTRYPRRTTFGSGDSADKFISILEQGSIWKSSPQKHFVPVEFQYR
ncbi:UDP-N-acetylglucosamine 2-epimerase [Paenibacillus sp. MB22_1]|uniref:UDP-N-acetylglucosamine 2-epimerase n=1 Tax=Paenibacillus sp. MB22_1 TaxID=3383121 RepID=UPI0039A1C7FF